jgi:uncharacterized protein YdaL
MYFILKLYRVGYVFIHKKNCLLSRVLLVCFIILQLFINITVLAASPPLKCVQIYYDKVPQANPKYYQGRHYAAFLQNLLGHFPNIQQYVIPIESYQSGQLDRCHASFYIGSYYGETHIPESFLHDFMATKKNVIWMGYDIWQLGPENLQKLWDVDLVGLGSLDWQHLDSSGVPGFFKFYDYKGEVFEKHGFMQPDKKKFFAAYDITLLKILNPASEKYVISWANHSTQLSNKTPYILQNENHWYMADVPFSYMHFDDRYLIFADVLFDMVNEKPYYTGKKPAFVRLEDVNVGTTTPAQIRTMSDLFYKNHAPFSIALIPIFSDPLGVVYKYEPDRYRTILQSKNFLEALSYAKSKGASFIMHGVTHQYDSRKNPYNGVSGSDFEFWDVVNQTPIAEDSIPYVVNRLSEGVAIMEKAGFNPVAWMPPHYNASPLDYILFGELFTWNVGQVTYVPYEISGYNHLPEALTFDNAGATNNAMRLQYLNKMVVNFPKNVTRFTQLLPYEIYGDYYRQRIIPEDVGDVQPRLSQQVSSIRTVDDMIKTIKRNRVLRDVWASFFLHGFLLNTPQYGGIARYPGDTAALEKLLQETQDAGYEFIDLQSWIKQNHRPKAPPAIEIDPPDYK